ncbi:hypothetical protein [Geodermatophilus sp. SYSU D00696]
MDVVVRGLRQALVVLLATTGMALAVAGLWSALQGSGFLRTLAVTLMVAAGALGLSSGAVFTRAHGYEHGHGPILDDHGSEGGVLTGVGVFLFVSLPLFAAGALLFGVA